MDNVRARRNEDSLRNPEEQVVVFAKDLLREVHDIVDETPRKRARTAVRASGFSGESPAKRIKRPEEGEGVQVEV